MTTFQSFLVVASCLLLLPSSNHGFTVPSGSATTSNGLVTKTASSQSGLLMKPDGTNDWMLRDSQEYNTKPNPPSRRREAVLHRYRPGGQGRTVQQGEAEQQRVPRQHVPQKQVMPPRNQQQQRQQQEPTLQAQAPPPPPPPPGPSREEDNNYIAPKPPQVRVTSKKRRTSKDEYYTDNPEMYRPANRFDQNHPFVNTPYGQANDIKRAPAAIAGEPKARVTYARANVNQWKAEQDAQDAFIHGAYGSGGPTRYGLDIKTPAGASPRPRRHQRPRDEGQDQQQSFIDGPYGNKGTAPGGYPPLERADVQSYPNDPQAEFANSPYGNRNGPTGLDYDIGGQKYERYRPQRQQQQRQQRQYRPQQDDFIDNHTGSNRMEYRGGPEPTARYERYQSPTPQRQQVPQTREDDFVDNAPPGTMRRTKSRLERFDPNRDDKGRYSQQDRFVDRSPGNNTNQEFDPRRYESRPIRSREQRQYEQEVREHREWQRRQQHYQQSTQDDFVHNPNGSSYTASQYGHGNDGW